MPDSLSFFTQRFFRSYLIGQNNYGKNTLTSYRDTFKLLLRYLKAHAAKKKQISLTSVDKDCVLSFLDWLQSERHNTATTRNIRLAHMKSFYSFVRESAPEFANHCEGIMKIPFTKIVTRPPAYLTESEVGHLLDAVDTETREGVRHLAMLTLLYDSGCRVQELIDLKVSDIRFGPGRRIFAHGKGDKYREIAILPETETLLRKYIEIYKLGSCELLFINHSGNQLTRQGVRYILKKYAKTVRLNTPRELDGAVFPHLLRHSKATHLVNHGINIYNVRDFLGHVSVKTTEIYLTGNPEVTRKAIEQVSSKTVPDSIDFYTPDEKQGLEEFLDTII